MPITSAYPILNPAATVDPHTAVRRSTQCPPPSAYFKRSAAWLKANDSSLKLAMQ
jgi:hypothetical protein